MNLTSPLNPVGRFMAYDRDEKQWVGFWNGRPVVADADWEQAGLLLDLWIYENVKKAA